MLERLARWREICPDLAIRSTFIVGFPGETEEDFAFLLHWLREARLTRVGCFRYEPVEGAEANTLPGAVLEEVKEERWHRFMAVQQEISRDVLAGRLGREIEVLIDEADGEGAIGRSGLGCARDRRLGVPQWRAGREASAISSARVVHADSYDLWAERVGT